MLWPQKLIDLADGTASTLHWQALSIVNAFVGAKNERAQAYYPPAGSQSVYTTANHAQAVSVWKAFQDWIADHFTNYVPRKKLIGGSWVLYQGPTWYGGGASMPAWGAGDFDDFCESAGCSRSGFRRIPAGTELPAGWWEGGWRVVDAASYSYGPIQHGDIIGPWIFVDLFWLFNELVRTKKDSPFHTDELTNGRYGAGIGEGSWAGAKATAEGDYPQDYPIPEDEASALTTGQFIGGSGYNANIRRFRALGYVFGTWTGKKKDAYWYAHPAKVGNDFDNYGDPAGAPSGELFAEGIYNLWLIDTTPRTDPASFYSSAYLGDNAAAPGRDIGLWCGEPVNAGGTGRGWMANATETAVLHWDVSGGFDYVEP